MIVACLKVTWPRGCLQCSCEEEHGWQLVGKFGTLACEQVSVDMLEHRVSLRVIKVI